MVIKKFSELPQITSGSTIHTTDAFVMNVSGVTSTVTTTAAAQAISTINTPVYTHAQLEALSGNTVAQRAFDSTLGLPVTFNGNAWGADVMFSKNVNVWEAAGSATPAFFGLGNTTTGTPTFRGQANTSFFLRRRRIGMLTAAAAASTAGTRHGANQWYISDGLVYQARFGTFLAPLGSRSFVGVTTTTTVFADADPSTFLNSFGMYFNAADSNWKIMSSDGTAATTVDLGSNFPCNVGQQDIYELTLQVPTGGGQINYVVKRLNTGHLASGSLTTNVVASTAAVGTQIWCSTGANTAAIALDVNRQVLITDY